MTANWKLLQVVLLATMLAGASSSPAAENVTRRTAPATSLDLATLSKEFAAPSAPARMVKIIHGWPDEAAAQDKLIAQMIRQGFGGVVCNVSFDQYLESDAKWRAFVRAVHAAHDAGLALWLYDERGYPSANAGGLVLRDHPEWEARGLLIASAETDGTPVEITAPPGKLHLAAAWPVRDGRVTIDDQVDLSTHLSNGRLTWTPSKKSHWRAVVVTEDRLYEGTHAAGNLWQKLPYPNLLLAEPTRRFLEVTHDRYAEKLGADLGQWFVATFTDEPSLMSCFLQPMPYAVLPWSPTLAAEFKTRRGYSLEPVLPALFLEAGTTSRQVRHDFWLTVGELVSENYFGQIQTWGRRHHIPSGGHLLMEESLAAHVPFYGDFFRCARRLDAPGIDCLTSLPPEVPWHIARLLASAAELDGRPLVMSETSDHAQQWRPTDDSRPKREVTATEIRGTAHRLMVAGVNRLTSYYTFAGLDDVTLSNLNTQLGRCAGLLTGGHQVADLAVVYPIESVWTRYQPSRHWAKDAAAALQVEHVWRAAAESLFAAQRDFTFVDSRALAAARVENGALVHGALRWRVVVLPMTDTLPMAAWNNLARFAQEGGVVIALGALPVNSDSEFPSARVGYLARILFGNPKDQPLVNALLPGGAGIYLPSGSEALLPLVLRGLIEPDVHVEPAGSPIRVTHRQRDGRDFYFVVNDSPKPWRGRVTFSAGGDSHRLDPATGRVSTNAAGSSFDLALDPYAAVFQDFAHARPPLLHDVQSGALPNLSIQPLKIAAQTRPEVAHGEFVRMATNAVTSVPSPSTRVWPAEATLTKSKVDTFLFLRFRPEKPLDLSSADCLAFDTWVPEGQHTANQLLVIVQEAGGGDFIADTARSLGTAGHVRVFVPCNRFTHAGWSKDADGIMDWSKMAEVRLGWGGYLGTEGEMVKFSAGPPLVGHIDAKVALAP